MASPPGTRQRARESEPALRPCPSSPTGFERRRPGRIENASSQLIALMRNPAVDRGISEPPPIAEDEGDPPQAACGIAVAIILSSAIWALIAFVLSLAF
jgi:hypothetical protein